MLFRAERQYYNRTSKAGHISSRKSCTGRFVINISKCTTRQLPKGIGSVYLVIKTHKGKCDKQANQGDETHEGILGKLTTDNQETNREAIRCGQDTGTSPGTKLTEKCHNVSFPFPTTSL